jgi:GT2 family glycosyltransferase
VSGLPRATVAIVNWNGRRLLAECLPSVAALDYPHAELEVVVVDNGSHDDSVAWLRSEWPAVRVVAHAENRGFAAGANDAAQAATGTVIAFLNNDCRVAADWLRRLIDALGSERAAAAGSRILDWDGRHVDFGGASMNFHGHGRHRDWDRPWVPGPPRPPEAALFACGGAMAVDRARFLASGGFDADYFAYFEDVDLGWRLWVLGERVVYVSDAIAYHRHRGSGMEEARWRSLIERNALASLFKNYDDANLAVVLPAARALLAARAEADGALGAGPYREAEQAFEAALPRLREARALVQGGRRRPDHEIVALFGEPLRPSSGGRAYWETQRRIVREHGLARVFGTGVVDGADGLGDFIGELQGRLDELEGRR